MSKSRFWHYTLCASLTLLFALANQANAGPFSGGDGTANNPYIIASVSDFQLLMNNSSNWSKNFALAADISLSGITITPIGNASTKFTGSFRGYCNKISNITLNSSSNQYVGLFGYIQSNAVVQDLFLENVSLTGCKYVGALAAYNAGSIINCSSKGTVSAVSASLITCVGGLIGYDYHSQGLFNNYSACTVTSSSTDTAYAGGLIGYYDGSSPSSFVTGSYATGQVSSISLKVIAGAFAGYVAGGIIDSCYSTGSVTASNSNSLSSIGGFAGSSNGTMIFNSYSKSPISAKSGNIGGLIGLNCGDIYHCFSTGNISAIITLAAGGLTGSGDGSCDASFWDKLTTTRPSSNGGTGKTTAQMQSRSTFTDAGWDFTGESTNGTNNFWHMPFNATGYPMLFIQYDIPGDIAGSYGIDHQDFRFIAYQWKNKSTNYNWLAMCDLAQPADGTVDFKDLMVLASNWLQGL